MDSFEDTSKIDDDENIDERSFPSQSERFSRRLSKYRDHQSDCQMKNDCNFREMCEQESLQVKKLQNQQTKEEKTKKNSQRNYKKNLKPKTRQLTPSVQPSQLQIEKDFADLNYREMFNLVSNDQIFRTSISNINNPSPHFPINLNSTNLSPNFIVNQQDLYYDQPFWGT